MLSAIPLQQGLVAAVWLALIVLLILGASRLARFLPLRLRQAMPQAGQAPENGMILRGSLALDLRRRLYLVEAGGQPTLILTGGAADLMLAVRAKS